MTSATGFLIITKRKFSLVGAITSRHYKRYPYMNKLTFGNSLVNGDPADLERKWSHLPLWYAGHSR